MNYNFTNKIDIWYTMNRLKELRKSKGITQTEISRMLGISQNNYSYWENGKVKIDNESLQKLADFFGITVDYLLGRNEKSPSNVFDVEGLLVYEEIGTVCAGFNGAINEIPTGKKIEIPASMISGGNKDDYFVLRVTGNSMYPKLLEGDTILCKRCDSVDSGDLAVVLYNGDEATVKKVNYITGQNWLELIPINPEYPSKRIEGTDLDQCRILGKVVKLIRDL